MAMTDSADAGSAKDVPWFAKFGAAVKGKVQGKDQDMMLPALLGNAAGEQHCQFLDLADAMEQGMSPGSGWVYAQAPPEDCKEDQSLIVVRSPDRSTYDLRDTAGRTMLQAKCTTNGLRYDFFLGNQEKSSPAFILESATPEKDDWELTSTRCMLCEQRGRRQCGKVPMMRVVHYMESVGEGQAFCMDVEFPVKENGQRAVMCKSCGDADAQWSVGLSARRPKWNTKHRSLTLDFRGRCSMASAKNFQLEDPREPTKNVFLYGKVDENRFVLDYQHPLGAAQAFAVALSASHWR